MKTKHKGPTRDQLTEREWEDFSHLMNVIRNCKRHLAESQK